MERIKVQNISKKFDLNKRKRHGALGKIIKLFSKSENNEIQVIKDISFTLNSGEILGIIGKNGSGKSTLLRILAGIYLQDEGEVRLNGESVYLAGLNNGLEEKLTMRENIYLVSSLLGLGQKDIKQKFNEIVEFSELKDYLDVKLSKFSSGMISKLAFSISIFCVSHKNPDILFLDEVIGAGGDIDFQTKALEKIEKLIKSGAAVTLVSHNLDIIKRYCNKVILLEKGQIIKSGKPEEVINYYKENYKKLS
jgi:ABC-type polysaccharide/polyol phosphate transport system ATPase subunit